MGSFAETVRQHGLRSARTLWQAMRRASLEFPPHFGVSAPEWTWRRGLSWMSPPPTARPLR